MQLRQPLNLRQPLQMTAHKIRPTLNLPFAASGTLGPLITFTRSSPASYFNSSGTLTSASTDTARFDYNPSTLIARGLLIEEARTNSIRNNTMVGVAAGTPGTLPTNWNIGGGGLGTLTQEIIGAGTTSGISYFDIRFSGTTSTTSVIVAFESTTQIVATTGQTWSNSFWLGRVGGAATNITGINSAILERNVAGGFIALGTGTDLSGSIGTFQRFAGSYTLAGGVPTERVNSGVILTFSSGVAIDITLRIGMPQLELGAFATSVISTSSAAVTRAADVASITGANFTSFWNATQGTIVVRSAVEAFSASNNGVFAIGDPTKAFGAAETLYDVYAPGAGNQQTIGIITGGATQGTITPNYAPTVNTFSTLAVGYAANNVGASTGGSAVVTDASVTLPTPTGMSIGSLNQGWSGAATYLNGWISSLAYYPVRLTNTQLQTLST